MKHHVALHATWREGSKTVEFYVEQCGDVGTYGVKNVRPPSCSNDTSALLFLSWLASWIQTAEG